MIVYIESNFLLELALGQKEASSAEAIFTLAEDDRIKLVFPGFAISEPFASVMHNNSERFRVRNSLEAMLKQLKQSGQLEPHKQVVSDLQPVLLVFADILEKELNLLHSSVDRLLNVGKAIEIDLSSFRQALIYQRDYRLSPQDSIIYSAIVTDLQFRPPTEAKCFVSRDKRAFSTRPAIKSELASYNCRYIGSFRDALNFIQRFA